MDDAILHGKPFGIPLILAIFATTTATSLALTILCTLPMRMRRLQIALGKPKIQPARHLAASKNQNNCYLHFGPRSCKTDRESQSTGRRQVCRVALGRFYYFLMETSPSPNRCDCCAPILANFTTLIKWVFLAF